ncbi:hypothetical protein JM83_1193 [Gillisia sp. Hel_I_86]|nr:hypothetical protein JM83_1193 [Gillisia sp. Hel_I_86]
MAHYDKFEDLDMSLFRKLKLNKKRVKKSNFKIWTSPLTCFWV